MSQGRKNRRLAAPKSLSPADPSPSPQQWHTIDALAVPDPTRSGGPPLAGLGHSAIQRTERPGHDEADRRRPERVCPRGMGRERSATHQRCQRRSTRPSDGTRLAAWPPVRRRIRSAPRGTMGSCCTPPTHTHTHTHTPRHMMAAPLHHARKIRPPHRVPSVRSARLRQPLGRLPAAARGP